MDYQDIIITNDMINGELLELLKKNNNVLIKYKNIFPNNDNSYYRIKTIHENVEEFNKELFNIFKNKKLLKKISLSYKKEFWLHKDIKYFGHTLLTTVINEKPVLVVIYDDNENESDLKNKIIGDICKLYRVDILPDEIN